MEIFGLKLTEYGPEALNALFIILLFTGRVVMAKDRDFWRNSALKSADQVDRLIETLEPILSPKTPKQSGDNEEGGSQ